MAELDTVENAYRLQLGWVLPRAHTLALEVDDPFVVARRAMEADAWRGGESDAFYQQCIEKGSTAGVAADDCVAALQARHRSEPARVASHDRRARFR